MSFFHRLARATTHPVGRAHYSSFSSSKPGGGGGGGGGGSGRHFISAKSPKPVLQTGRANPDNTTATQPAISPSADTTSVVNAAPADENTSSKPAESQPHSSPSITLVSPFSSSNRPPIHPTFSSKDYKLHQFFSLHRPLLLLSQPTSVIFEAVDLSASFISSEDHISHEARATFATIDNPPESSPDADADAARQLAHTLVMNRVAGAVAWQESLSRLGLSTKYSENDMTLAKETAQEWVTVYADSTRRKKRKKMKKHKLKKRRRLTRRQNK